MQLSSAPLQIQLPFANGDGSKTNPIPVPSQIGTTPGAASFTDGFPPLCATPVSSGGVPPSKADMDGILFMLSAIDLWNSAGAGFQYNSGYSTAIGGYPKGARVLNANGTDYWTSIVDNNVTNPDTGGAGWIPRVATSSVYASAQQTLASGNAKILWNTVEFDFYGLWNSGGSRFQALWAGKYRFSGSLYLPSPAGQLLTTQVWKNGALAKQCFQAPQVSDGGLTLPFDVVSSLAIGDYLEAYIVSTSGPTLAGQVGSNQAFVFGQIEYMGS